MHQCRQPRTVDGFGQDIDGTERKADATVAAEVRRLMLPLAAAAGMFVTAGRARATRWARISTPPATCRDRSLTRSACREMRTSISAGQLASWQT